MKVAVRLSSFLILGMVAILAIEAAVAVLHERKFIRDDMGHDPRLPGRAMSGLVVDVWLAKGQQRAFDLISEVNRHEQKVNVMNPDLSHLGGRRVLVGEDDAECGRRLAETLRQVSLRGDRVQRRIGSAESTRAPWSCRRM